MSATPIPIPELTLEAVTANEEILVRCSGRITASTSGTLQTKVRSLIPETKCVVLDLTDVNYIDSFGLGALVSVYLSAKRRHCELKLINLSQRFLGSAACGLAERRNNAEFAPVIEFQQSHKTLRITPAMAARAGTKLWEIGDIVAARPCGANPTVRREIISAVLRMKCIV